jgi:ribonuclease E
VHAITVGVGESVVAGNKSSANGGDKGTGDDIGDTSDSGACGDEVGVSDDDDSFDDGSDDDDSFDDGSDDDDSFDDGSDDDELLGSLFEESSDDVSSKWRKYLKSFLCSSMRESQSRSTYA